MRFLVIFIALASGGCRTWVESQALLTDQARRGVELCRAANAGHRQVVAQLHQLQRGRLDGAFDADVRDQPALAADWVVEHRKAYAAALDALHAAQQSSLAAVAAEGENLNAVDAALVRLRHLQQIQTSVLDALPAPAAGPAR